MGSVMFIHELLGRTNYLFMRLNPINIHCLMLSNWSSCLQWSFTSEASWFTRVDYKNSPGGWQRWCCCWWWWQGWWGWWWWWQGWWGWWWWEEQRYGSQEIWRQCCGWKRWWCRWQHSLWTDEVHGQVSGGDTDDDGDNGRDDDDDDDDEDNNDLVWPCQSQIRTSAEEGWIESSETFSQCRWRHQARSAE